MVGLVSISLPRPGDTQTIIFTLKIASLKVDFTLFLEKNVECCDMILHTLNFKPQHKLKEDFVHHGGLEIKGYCNNSH